MGSLPAKISDLFSPGKSRLTAPRVLALRAQSPAGPQNEVEKPRATGPESELYRKVIEPIIKGVPAAKRPAEQPPEGAVPHKIQKRGQILGSRAPSLADAQDLQVTQAKSREGLENAVHPSVAELRVAEAALDTLRGVDWETVSLTQLGGTQVALLQVAHNVALAIRNKSS